jgi:hypothetical protein
VVFLTVFFLEMQPTRAEPMLIYRRTRNLRAVQLLVGYTKLERTVRYLGIEDDDALEIADQTDVQSSHAGSGRRARRSLTRHNRSSSERCRQRTFDDAIALS